MPRILLESFPLTLKKGTGIYTYSLNLLKALNELDIHNIGLLLLFETRVRKLVDRRSKKKLVILQNYADLMDELYRSEGVDMGQGWRRLKWLTSCVLAQPGIIDIPDYMKPSLREILTENTPTPFDFLEHNHPYVVDLPRPNLIVKSRVNATGQVKVKRLVENYDVFHCTHLSPLSVPGLPRVTTVHDIIPLLRPELTRDNRRLFAELLQINLQASDQVIAVSEATKKDLVEFCNISPEKVSVVHEAASTDLAPMTFEEAAPFLRSLKLITITGEFQPYFLFIGNIEPKKNVRRIVEAFQQFSLRDKTGYKLVIVGSRAWGYDAVRDLLEGLIKRRKVLITGYLPVNYLPALLSQARAFLFPSLIEGFGLPVLEAMACGCPVITSTAPSITEICGDAAIQVDPLSVAQLAQAMSQVAANDPLYFSLKEKGFKQNALFSWERCAKETLEVYRTARQNYSAKGKAVKPVAQPLTGASTP
jgi:glycosyltransferase involved in cell wall biosynthesis